MTTTFTTYADALHAISMVEIFAYYNNLRIPQFTIVFFEDRFVVSKD